MPGHFSARVNIVGILRYQVYILEDEAMEIIDLGGLRIADVEELGTIKLAHRTLLNDEYSVVQVLRLQKRVYVIHEDGELILPVAIRQYDGHVEERMAIERFPLAAWQDTESSRHRHWILPGMLLRVEQLRGSSTVDGNYAGVIPRWIRLLHLVVDILGLDEGVMRGESRRMEAVTQHKYRRHGVRQPARVIVEKRDEHLENIHEGPHLSNLYSTTVCQSG